MPGVMPGDNAKVMPGDDAKAAVRRAGRPGTGGTPFAALTPAPPIVICVIAER